MGWDWHIRRATYMPVYTVPVCESSSSWREAFSRNLPPLRSFARTVGPPLAAGPRSLLHPCRGRSGGSRWSTVSHRRVSTPVKAAHHPSSWCRFVGSGLLVQTYSTTHALSQILSSIVFLIPFGLLSRILTKWTGAFCLFLVSSFYIFILGSVC